MLQAFSTLQRSFDRARDRLVLGVDPRSPGAGEGPVGGDEIFVEVPARGAAFLRDPLVERMSARTGDRLFRCERKIDAVVARAEFRDLRLVPRLLRTEIVG